LYKTYRVPRLTILVLSITTAFASLFILIATTNGSVLPEREELPYSQNKVAAYSAHYIVLEMASDGTIHPLTYQLVQLSGAPATMNDLALSQQLQQSDRNAQQLAVELKTNTGKIVYQNVIQLPRWLRGEFHADTPASQQAPIDGHYFPLQNPVFVVRVPAISGTSLVISNNQKERIAEFNLEQLAQNIPAFQHLAANQPKTMQAADASGNRVDFLIMGDGYTASEQAKFIEDAANFAEQFFTISPYAEYKNYFITHTLFVASNESGADHPPCAGEPNVHYVDTAFDASYCTNNILRLLTVNSSKVFAAATAVPEWDEILVIVNDPMYGGAGGTFAVVSMDSRSVEIGQHEFGHSFVNLADEYDTAYPGYPSCSDISGQPCEANVTDATTRSLIKWNPWISPTTPIPTEPEFDAAFANVVGLFEGARYLSTDMYRSGQNCIMQSLGQPFCQVSSQAYVLKLYNGGWGIPSSGISMIEPGSLVPANNTISLTFPNSQQFQAELLQPMGGPPAKIQWFVNGVLDPLAQTDTFTFTPDVSTVGTEVEIQLRVEDTTSLVHPEMAGNALKFRTTWTVSVIILPVTSLIIEAPPIAEPKTNTNYPFTATVNLTASTPVTYSWQVSGQPPLLAIGGTSNTIDVNWSQPGSQTITVTATNIAGAVMTDTVSVTVTPKTFWIFLPAVFKVSDK